MENLRAVSVLGRGGKGVVFLVRHSSSGQAKALKVISKASVERKAIRGKEAFRRIWLEREVLSSLRHPLLPKLHGFVSTEKIFGFIIDCCPGGSLASLRNRQSEKMFSDNIIRSLSRAFSIYISISCFSVNWVIVFLTDSTPQSLFSLWNIFTCKGSCTEI